MRLYLDKSPLVLTKVIPFIVNEAVVKYEHSQKNLGRYFKQKAVQQGEKSEKFETEEHDIKHQITYMKDGNQIIGPVSKHLRRCT